MKPLQLNMYQPILGVALFIVGIALVVGAVLVVLFTDFTAAGAAVIGVPGLVLIGPSRRQ